MKDPRSISPLYLMDAIEPLGRRAMVGRRLAGLDHRGGGSGIERCRRIVQQHHRCIGDDRASDGDAATLAARQADTALAERRVVPVR